MQGGVKLNQPQPAAPKKRFSKEELSHKFQKNEPKNVQKPMQVGSGFNEKMKNMEAMFAQKGGFGAPRPSAQITGMPHELANLMINNNDNNQGQGHEDLEKKLENWLFLFDFKSCMISSVSKISSKVNSLFFIFSK